MVVASAAGELAFPLVQTHTSTHAGADRVRAFTLIVNVGPAAALAVSPLVSGLVVGWWGVRAAFVLAALLTAVSVVFFSRLSPGHDRRRRPERATSYREALAEPTTRRLLTLQFATLFALALGTTFVPIFLQDERGLSPATITWLGSIWAIGAALYGLLVTRVGRLQREPCVAIAIAVSLVAASLAALTVVVPLWLIAVVTLGRGGFFSAWALYLAALGEIVTERYRSRVFALSEMLGGTAVALSPVLAGLIYAWRPAAPLLAAAVLAVLLVPIILRTQRLLGEHSPVAAAPLVEPELA
jgi:MFS family permease